MTAGAPRARAATGPGAFHVAAAIWIAAISFLAYWNTLDNEFVWDDVSSILSHEHVQNPAQFWQLFQETQHAFIGSGEGNFYRPLVSASFMLDFWLTRGVPEEGEFGMAASEGLSPLLFHVQSIAWHALAAIGLIALLSMAGAPRWVQVSAAAIWAVHPLHTEAVAYISGRADSMAAAFMFWGLAAALMRGTSQRVITGAVLAGLCTAGAVLSKESGALLPIVLAVMVCVQLWCTPGQRRMAAADAAPALGASFAVLVIYAALRMTVLQFGEGSPAPDSTFVERVLETGQALALYAKVTFVPTGLHMERVLAGTPVWLGSAGMMILALLAAGIAAALYKRHARIAMGLLIFVAAWLPISGLIPLNAPMAEHWLYVPLAGLFWAACELFALRNAAAAKGLGAVVLAVLGVYWFGLTVERNEDWRSNEALFEATLSENFTTQRVHYNLAVALESQRGNRLGAIRHYQEYLRLMEAFRAERGMEGDITEEELLAQLSLGDIYWDLKRPDLAFAQYQAVLQQGGNFPAISLRALTGFARAAASQGNVLAAARALEQAQSLDPAVAAEAAVALRGRTMGSLS